MFSYSIFIILLIGALVVYIYYQMTTMQESINILETKYKNIDTRLNALNGPINKQRLVLPNNQPTIQKPSPPMNIYEHVYANNNPLMSFSDKPVEELKVTKLPETSIDSDSESYVDEDQNLSYDNMITYSNDSKTKMDVKEQEKNESVQEYQEQEQEKNEPIKEYQEQDQDPEQTKILNLAQSHNMNDVMDVINNVIGIQAGFVAVNPIDIITPIIVENNEKEYSIDELMRMKLDELKEIAKKKDIEIIKTLNGKKRNKTKNELCNDIINKK